MQSSSLLRAVHADGKWQITVKPSVSGMFKRIFDGVEKVGQKLVLSDTPANARNLLWFAERYKSEFVPHMRVLAQANLQDEREEAVLRILSEDYKPSNPQLALPLRDYQARAVDLTIANGALLLGDSVGLGKQHPVDTKVLTPSGWRRIGDMKVGDEVIGSGGKPTKVTGVFPQGVKPSYRVRFSDGASVEAGPGHLWTFAYRCGGRRWQEIVVTTDQIRTGATITTDWPNGIRRDMRLAKTPLYLPIISAPVEFGPPPSSLPIPPYTMGQLLANGALTHSTALTTNTLDWPEIRARLESEGTSVGAVHVYGGATRASIKGLNATVRNMGIGVLSGAKRVPAEYMRASAADRLSLFQGLMDGDGSCSSTRNRVNYHSTSLGLSEDVRELVEQLGGIATVRTYDRTDEGKPVEYQVRIKLPLHLCPFHTRRKASKLEPERRVPTRTFVSAEYVRDVESVCIRVAAEDHLYATEHCILTHNTAVGIGLAARADGLPAVVVTLTALPVQWAREFKRFAPELRVHVVKTGKPYPLDRNSKGQKIPLPDVVILSYSKLTTRAAGCRSWAEVLSEAGYNRTFILDEGQELRNPDTDRYRAAKLLRETAIRCLLLSATPVVNHGAEIHAVVNIVQPGALGDQKEFLREWCDKEVNGDGELSGETMRKTRVTDPVALGSHLRDIGVFLRRKREEVGRELPPLQRVFHEIEIDEGEIEMDGAEIERLCQMVIRGGRESFKASGDLDWRLRQATGIAKAMHVVGFVRLLIESGERVVLYGWHREVYSLWLKAFSDTSLGDLKPSFYTGEESVKQKDEQLQRFLRKETPLLIISLRAGAGVDGIQYSGCRTVVFGEFDWSPGILEQNVGRVFRDGQPDPVMAYFLWANWGADPVMMDALNLKTEQSEGIRNLVASAALLKGADSGQIRKLAEAHLRRIGKL